MQAAELWNQALSYDAYVAQMRENRSLFERREPATVVEARDRAAFGGAPLRLLVLTEDFCGDSAQFIPAAARLARELDNLELRLLLRNEQREFAAPYVRKDGYQAIPVFIALDADGHELGYLIERPQAAYPELAAETRRFVQEHPELEGANRTYANMPEATRKAVLANSNVFRDAQQARWTRYFFDELAEVVAAGRQRLERDAAD
jgi:hypothetical protein